MSVINGRWQCVRAIGEGGQGQAFLARDLKDGSDEWVLKLLKNRQRLGRFEREILALQAIASDYIPTIRDYSLDRPAYVVTRFLGRDLTKHPRIQELTTKGILGVFRQVVLAVRDAYGAGVIHRDIKPNNIVLSDSGLRAYVIDFGICQYTDRQLTSLTKDEAFGNAGFAAPECFLGSEEAPTAASDVYSLGKVLYWLSSRGGFINRESN
jgi:serine/threonine protein kinase